MIFKNKPRIGMFSKDSARAPSELSSRLAPLDPELNMDVNIYPGPIEEEYDALKAGAIDGKGSTSNTSSILNTSEPTTTPPKDITSSFNFSSTKHRGLDQVLVTRKPTKLPNEEITLVLELADDGPTAAYLHTLPEFQCFWVALLAHLEEQEIYQPTLARTRSRKWFGIFPPVRRPKKKKAKVSSVVVEFRGDANNFIQEINRHRSEIAQEVLYQERTSGQWLDELLSTADQMLEEWSSEPDQKDERKISDRRLRKQRKGSSPSTTLDRMSMEERLREDGMDGEIHEREMWSYWLTIFMAFAILTALARY